jgi:hypothetical protein
VLLMSPAQACTVLLLRTPAQVDVFAFGLVVLELTTMKRLDHSNSYAWPELLESVKDEVCPQKHPSPALWCFIPESLHGYTDMQRSAEHVQA